MMWTKLKPVTAVLLALGSLAGAGGLLHRSQAGQRHPIVPPPVTADRGGEKKPAATDREKLQGTWEVVELVKGGEKVMPVEGLKGRVVFEGDAFRFILTPPGKADLTRTAATVKLDPSKSPRAIDVTVTDGPSRGDVLPGIYELNGDDLKLCVAEGPNDERPTEFKGEGKQVLFTLKRSKK